MRAWRSLGSVGAVSAYVRACCVRVCPLNTLLVCESVRACAHTSNQPFRAAKRGG